MNTVFEPELQRGDKGSRASVLPAVGTNGVGNRDVRTERRFCRQKRIGSVVFGSAASVSQISPSTRLARYKLPVGVDQIHKKM